MMDVWVQSWMRAFELEGIDEGTLDEVLKEIADSTQIAYEKLIDEVISLCQPVSEMLEDLEKCGVFDYEQTAKKKKWERDRRLAVKMAHVARFSRYDNRRLYWAVKRQTKPRARERGPPAQRQAAIHREKE